MEVTINYNGQAVAVEVTLEVYEFLDRADHKTENLFHEQRRHWDGREFDEFVCCPEHATKVKVQTNIHNAIIILFIISSSKFIDIKLAGGEQHFMLFADGKSTRDRRASVARECSSLDGTK